MEAIIHCPLCKVQWILITVLLFIKIICSERTTREFKVPSVDETTDNKERHVWKILEGNPLREEFSYDASVRTRLG
jgi:hypothetical protein